jgi:hypothetical protein
MSWKPPPEAEVSPARLFRSLLHPLPAVPLSFRFAGVGSHTLYACALSAAEANEALDAAEGLEEPMRSETITLGLVARSLRADGKRVFQSATSVAVLPDIEVSALTNEVVGALKRISPLHNWCDEGAWREVLKKGARHHSNRTAVLGLGAAHELDAGPTMARFRPRPDLYFGRPLGELLDCHWFAYYAARAVYEEWHSK